jgi:hypothetical protein
MEGQGESQWTRYFFNNTRAVKGPLATRAKSLAWNTPSCVPYRRLRCSDIHVYNYLNNAERKVVGIEEYACLSAQLADSYVRAHKANAGKEQGSQM